MEKENRHITYKEPDELALLQYIRDTVSEEEEEWIETWLKGNEYGEHLLLQLATIDHALQTQKRIESRNVTAAYNKVNKRIQTVGQRIWLKQASWVAACFLGVLVMSTALSFWMVNKESAKTQCITVKSNAGMRTHFNLPDGTIAYLNSGSVLSYPLPYDKTERRVTLKGEAYFKVAHNPEQPFIVSVANDNMRVKVLGTEFNLQSYEEGGMVQTTLVSGAVNLQILKNGNVVSSVNLKPSEKAIYNVATNSVSVSTVHTEYETSWKEGRLIFKDMPLPEVLKKLAYFYNVKFDVKDPVINSFCFTGTFDNKQLSQILDYLRISSRIKYTINHVKSDDDLNVQHTIVVLQME